MPAGCNPLGHTPAIPWPVASVQATQCSGAFLAENYALATPVASCFAGVDSPDFDANVAYSCLAQADVWCKPTAVCKAAPRPSPTNALGEGGFEDGAFWPNASGGFGGADVIAVAISSERVRTGKYALKMAYSNANGGARSWIKPVRLEAGGLYEVSWWFLSTNDKSDTASGIYFNGGGVILSYEVSTRGVPVGQWTRASKTFVAASTYGTAQLLVSGNRETAGNVLYVDDFSLMRID